MIKTYAVRSGDHLAKIAHDEGLDPDEVWNHPKNKVLRDKRKDKNILCEGDVLFLPLEEPTPLALQAGRTNRYSAVIPTVETHLSFADKNGPFASEPYTVEGLDEPIEGMTDRAGNLTIKAKVGAKVARVIFMSRRLQFDVLLGEMDPITEVSGVQLRLVLLGYLKGKAAGELDEESRDALRAFQKAKRLPVTGATDQATLDALKDAYGC
ncbi:MAG: peptidoglycan-binding domain-containing protein [Byssovorax sp.]